MEAWVALMYYQAFTWLNLWAGVVITHLLSACISGGWFVGIVWLVCRAFPRLPVTARCWFWWLACLKLAAGLFWVTSVDLPLLPSSLVIGGSPAGLKQVQSPPASAIAAPTRSAGLAAIGTQPAQTAFSPARSAAVSFDGGAGLDRLEWQHPEIYYYQPPHYDHHLSLAMYLLMAWIVGMILCANRIERRLRRLRRLLRRAETVVPVPCEGLTSEMTALLRLRRQPRILVSSETVSPLVAGLFRPAIVLPPPAPDSLSQEETRMVLAHELAHVRRGDLWLAWIPIFSQGLFFFFPPLWLALREWTAAREVACDMEAMRLTGASVREYGQVLIRISSASSTFQPAGALYATGAFVQMKRRVELMTRFGRGAPHIPAPLRLALSSLMLLCLIPWHMTARPGPASQWQVQTTHTRQVRYRITDLGATEFDDGPRAINRLGEIVGYDIRRDMRPGHPNSTALWLWNAGKKSEVRRLPSPASVFINDSGQILAADPFSAQAIFINHGSARKLCAPGYAYSTPNGLNNRGDMIMRLSNPLGPGNRDISCLWQGGNVVELNAMDPIALNDVGQIIGMVNTRIWSGDALWDHGQITPLGYAPGFSNSRAVGINNRGIVVGYAEREDSSIPEPRPIDWRPRQYSHLILWYQGKVADVGSLAPFSLMYPSAINDAGQVVGTASSDQSLPAPRAFLYSRGEMSDLNFFIPANSGWKLQSARGINGKGQIIGNGTYQGKPHSYLLSPIERQIGSGDKEHVLPNSVQ